MTAFLILALRLCPTEDSTMCIWVGPVQGNGRGAIVLNLGE